jgi:hypothetical protein
MMEKGPDDVQLLTPEIAKELNIGVSFLEDATAAYFPIGKLAENAPVQERRSSFPATPQIELERHWDLNGSLVKLESNGASRRFLYLDPREGLVAVGVTQGAVEFEGTQNGNVYTGTAYVFSRICGAIGFAVSGYLAQDEQSITLKGDVPYVDKQCRATGGRPGVLVYQLTDR